MLGFHSYFVTPRTKQDRVSFHKFELLTWVASAIQWRKLYGSISFVTDAEGLKVLASLGLGELYSSIRVLASPFSLIDPAVYWAAGKIIAMQSFVGRQDVYSIDTDCIVWNPLRGKDGLALVGLNYDNPGFYSIVSSRMVRFFPDWDSISSAPINAAILGFPGYCGKGSLLDVFTSTSIKLMEVASAEGNLDSASMIFAEQKLSAEVCTRMGLKYGVLCKASEATGYHIEVDERSKYITHLWDTKERYRDSASARTAYIEWLSREIEPSLGKFRAIWTNIFNSGDIITV